jgi:hypothetical protein
VETLEAGTHGVLVGMRGCHVCTTPLDQVVGAIKPLDKGLLKIAAVLAH